MPPRAGLIARLPLFAEPRPALERRRVGWAGRCLGLVCVLALTSIAATTPPAARSAAPAPLEVRPGSVVRWPGTDTRECRLGDLRLTPIAGSCYLPIDLAATGTLVAERQTAGGTELRTLRVVDYPYPTEAITGVDDKYVAPSAAELARIEREQEEVGKLWRLATPRAFELPLGAPLSVLGEASRFGSRRSFNGELRSPHGGADYRAAPGTPVFAPADGRVALAEEHYFAGRAVYVDHGDGLISMAFHLSEILVAAGQKVTRGELLGRVGATGRVTGPHLHFALRWHGARVDPAQLLGPPEAIPSLAGAP